MRSISPRERRAMHRFIIRFLSSFIPSKRRRREFRSRHGIGRVAIDPCKIGAYSYLSHGCKVADARTTIGKYCSIGVDVVLGTSRHPTDWLSTSPIQYIKGFKGFPAGVAPMMPNQHAFESTLPVVMGNDVWIGMRSIIMDGVKIGDGAVIGAGAVVTKDVPPYAIVVGVPAKLIRYRFDTKTIDRLLATKWWNEDDSVLATLDFRNVAACLERLEMSERDSEQ